MRKCLLFLLFFVWAVVSAQAQTFINLNGKVTDEATRPIAKATVRLLNTELYSFTNDSGLYNFPTLKAGRYTIEVSAAGYASTAELINIVTNGEHLDFKLQSRATQ